jgi:Flp pilus assembly protein TadG
VFRTRSESGQATVETALLLPLLAVFLLLIAHVGIVIRQQVLVTHASREAARVLSVENNPSRARAAVHRGAPDAETKFVRPQTVGSYVEVTVTDRVESPLAILRIVLPGVTVTSTTSMRVEK